MKTSLTEKYSLLTAEHSFETFVSELREAFDSSNPQNIVLDLSEIATTEAEISSLTEFATIQLENNLSFVIIVPTFDADAFDEELNVVPTLIEAQDMIDMDEMTRDLGF